MSEINANIIVDSILQEIIVTENPINITPTGFNMNIYTGGYAVAAGNVTEVQYNSGGIFAGASGLIYDAANSETEITNLIVSNSANLGNLVTANYYSGILTSSSQPNITTVGNLTNLTVNGNTNTSFLIASSNVIAGNIVSNNQINANSINSNTVNATGNISANFFIGNGSQLTGIDTTLIQNGSANVRTFANANVAISAAGNANVLLITGSGIDVANVNATLLTGTLTTNSQPNITTIGNLSNLTVTGNITSGNANLGNSVIANYFTGNFYGNANAATTAGTVTTNAQPNITSLGNLTGINVTGNASFTGSNIYISNINNFKIPGGNNAYYLQTDGTGNLTWQAGTVTPTGNGTVGGANTQIQFNDSSNFGGATGFTFDKSSNLVNMPGSANIVGNVTAAYFIGNGYYLTDVGSNLSNGNSNISIIANGNINFSSNGVANVATITNNNFITGNANITTLTTSNIGFNFNNQSNVGATGTRANWIWTNSLGITSVINWTNAAIALGNGSTAGTRAIAIGNVAVANSNDAIAIGNGANGSQNGAIAIGLGAKVSNAGANSIAIGYTAGSTANLGAATIAIGTYAGIKNTASNDIRRICIGANAGHNTDSDTVHIGSFTGNNAGLYAIGIGYAAAQNAQGVSSIALGAFAGNSNQANYAIAIGANASPNSQGINSISIGYLAGGTNAQANNSIILNATGAALEGSTANATFIKPIRTVNSTVGLNQLYYDSTTGEIVVYVP